MLVQSFKSESSGKPCVCQSEGHASMRVLSKAGSIETGRRFFPLEAKKARPPLGI